ncbi:MAG TPA: hypothetical protein VFG33_31695 [Kribbella sp.]|nr:hypothetical protein [Kribbella sp.]HET6297987.1 hypothetical protein [Kribbella sp.]
MTVPPHKQAQEAGETRPLDSAGTKITLGARTAPTTRARGPRGMMGW